MKMHARMTAVIVLSLMLAACGGFELQHMGSVKPIKNPYFSTLYSGYLTRAEHEQSYGHYVSADAYAIKARKVAGGEAVAIFMPNDEGYFPDGMVPAIDRDAMTDARKVLTGLLQAGAAKVSPADSANAQVMYDCWVEEQSYIDDFNEANQPDHAAFCRDGFNSSLALVQGAMQVKPVPGAVASVLKLRPEPELESEPEPESESELELKPESESELELELEPEPVAKVPNSYLVFFNWGSSELSDDAMDVIAQTVENARRGKVTWIMAVGHADTSGAPAYNDGLSRRRAESVGSALVARGIPHNQITIGSKGEEEPFVPTGDGIREAQNRRVLVSFPGR